MIAKLWPLLQPFCGPAVRRMAAFLTLAVALPRLPGWPGAGVVYPLQFFPQEAFGWLTLVSGLLLLATMGVRLRFVGRLAALFAFAVWALLAASTTSATSVLVDMGIMYALLGEIIALNHDC